MGPIRMPDPVFLFAGMIAQSKEIFNLAQSELKKSFGEVSYQSPVYPWDRSGYYEEEIGRDLKRRFLFFAESVMPDRLADIKIETNRIERLFLNKTGRNGKRTINIDPGYMNMAKVVLATTKDFSHRVYLRDGIYAEVTLIYIDDSYWPLPYTFPDFRSENYIGLFNSVRGELKSSSKLSSGLHYSSIPKPLSPKRKKI
ncbi:MAG: DUF4416 family protein [Nitrospirota bacterium]